MAKEASWRINKQNRSYIRGRPLSHDIRLKLFQMFRRGINVCEIARQIQVNHGTVSNILKKYKKTGSIFPKCYQAKEAKTALN